MFVYDPLRHRSYQINSPASANAGFQTCAQGQVPLYTDGTCVSPPNPLIDITKIGSTFVHRNGAWAESCVSDKNGLKCCAPPKVPSPQSGHCIKTDGPSGTELNLQVRTLDNGARYVAQAQSDAWRNALPEPAVYLNTVVPASSVPQDMTMRRLNTSDGYIADGTKTHRQSAKRQQRSSGRRRRSRRNSTRRRRNTGRRNTGRRDAVPAVVVGPLAITAAPTVAPAAPTVAPAAPPAAPAAAPAVAPAAPAVPGSAPRNPAQQAAYEQLLNNAGEYLFGGGDWTDTTVFGTDVANNAQGPPLLRNAFQWVAPRPAPRRIEADPEQAAALQRQEAERLERRAFYQQYNEQYNERRRAARQAARERRELELQEADRRATELRERRRAERLAQLTRQADQADMERRALVRLAEIDRQQAARQPELDRRRAQWLEQEAARRRLGIPDALELGDRQMAEYEARLALLRNWRPQAGNRPPPAVPMHLLGVAPEYSPQNSPQNSPPRSPLAAVPAAQLPWDVNAFVAKAIVALRNPNAFMRTTFIAEAMIGVPEALTERINAILIRPGITVDQFINELYPLLTPEQAASVVAFMQQQHPDVDETVDCSPHNNRRDRCRGTRPCVYEEPSGLCYNPRTYVQPVLGPRHRRAPERLGY